MELENEADLVRPDFHRLRQGSETYREKCQKDLQRGYQQQFYKILKANLQNLSRNYPQNWCLTYVWKLHFNLTEVLWSLCFTVETREEGMESNMDKAWIKHG